VCVCVYIYISLYDYYCVLQLPVITDLRNPTLKPRHWESIEQILDYHFSPEDPLTLGKLEEIHAFKCAEELQEISGRASSEASLEAILKKVRFYYDYLLYMLLIEVLIREIMLTKCGI